MSIEELIRLLSGEDHKSGFGTSLPPLSSEARKTAADAAHEALAPKQSDEAHLIIRPFGPDGDVLVRSEQWVHGKGGFNVVTHEVRVLTCTGELVEPKGIQVFCLVCGGHDSVVTHCRCGIALCRRCLRRDPVDNSPVCPLCFHRALESFDTWLAYDRQRSKSDSNHD